MEKNGKSFKIIMYLVGVLITILIGVIGFIGKGVIANEKESLSRDAVQDVRHYEAVAVQQTQNQNITELLVELKTDIKYLRKNGD